MPSPGGRFVGGGWSGWGRSRFRRLFEQAIERFVLADHAHVGACPFLDGHQATLQILDFGRQRAVALGQRRIVLLLCLDDDLHGMGLPDAAFGDP